MVVDFRPHVMNWTLPTESTIEPVTGYEIPGEPGITKSVPCRFHLGGVKEFKNEDNSVVRQVGRIRVDVGVDMPVVGQVIDIPGHFNGQVRDIYRGQLTWRIDV